MEEKVENVVEETTKENITVVDTDNKAPEQDDGVIRVDLSKPPPTKTQEDAVPEQSTDEVPVRDESETSEEVSEEDAEGDKTTE